MNASVSIVVPILNEATSLPQLLSGIGQQTVLPHELIFVDAGSTDGSAELIESWWRTHAWSPGDCKVLRLTGGLPGGGRNLGIHAAKSDWIAFIDGGITPDPGWIEQLLACAKSRDTKAMFGYCHFDAEGSFARAICALTYGLGAEHPVLPASIFHRDALGLIGPFREDLRAAEDILWTRKFGQLFGPWPTCPGARVHYRQFPDSVSSVFLKWRRNEHNAVRAGVRGAQQLLYFLGLPALWCAPFVTPAEGGLVFLLYVVSRGILDPMRRSASLYWWRDHPSAFLIAIGMSVLIDMAKWIGIAEGVIEKFKQSSAPDKASGDQPLSNVDTAVVSGFGDEWTRMPQTRLSAGEQANIFTDYFDIFPWASLPTGSVGADIGCGSGRWAQLAAERCGTLHVADASTQALEVARKNLSHQENVIFHHASVGKLPFPDEALDFAYSLGVLHHVPDHDAALREIARTLKPGAPFLVYLYYAFDNRPPWFRAIWSVSNVLRIVISRMPHSLRFLICQILAMTAYWPLSRLGAALEKIGHMPAAWPLAYYRDKSFYTMRTDALDRFGTRLEKRFTRNQIQSLLEQAGFRNVRFSDKPPFWCAVAVRAAHDHANQHTA